MEKSSDLPDTLTKREMNNLLRRFTPFSNVYEMVDWFENGRRHLLTNFDEAAREMGAPPAFVRAVLASAAFRRAYFDHIHKQAFNPDVLESGMRLLAEDFTNPDVATRDRLAIFRMLQELFGLTPTQRIQHEINQKVAHIHIEVKSTPDDFIDVDADVVGEAEGELGPGDASDARAVSEIVEESEVVEGY